YRQALEGYSEDLAGFSETIDDDEAQAMLSQTSELLASTKNTVLESNFIGFANYKKYFKDKRMWLSLSNTTIFTVISVFFELVIGLLVALLINRSFRGRGIIRASVLIPWAVPTA